MCVSVCVYSQPASPVYTCPPRSLCHPRASVVSGSSEGSHTRPPYVSHSQGSVTHTHTHTQTHTRWRVRLPMNCEVYMHARICVCVCLCVYTCLPVLCTVARRSGFHVPSCYPHHSHQISLTDCLVHRLRDPVWIRTCTTQGCVQVRARACVFVCVRARG